MTSTEQGPGPGGGRAGDREPILPPWATDRETLRATAQVLAHRWVWRGGRALVALPRVLVMLVAYSPRGLARVTGAVARYLYDQDTADLRHHHARNIQTAEYQRAHTARRTNLHARWVVAGTVVLLVAGPVLALVAPQALCIAVGVLAGAWVVKLIPGRGLGELTVGAAVAGAIAWWGPGVLATIPRPPAWPLVAAGAVLVLVLGWHGRNRDRHLVADTRVSPGVVLPLRADVVTRALCDLGSSQMKEPDSIRLLMDVARHGPGYQIDLELPPGVAASWVMERREQFAAALRRELGCVWPSIGPRHPGHLSVFVSDQPMNTARQAPWSLLKAGQVNLFRPVPMFTNQRNQWVETTIAYTAWIVGAVPRMGKTFFVRQFGLVAGLDTRARVLVFDLKGTGDLSPLAKFAHVYSVGDEPEDIAYQLGRMKWVRDEMRRRSALVRDLTLEQNPDKGKVTDALATADPGKYGPIVVCIDECQVWFEEFPDKAVRDEFIGICRDLVKRGPALGIIVVWATQKPDANAIPTAIKDNASARVCFKVNGWKSNDQVLGDSSHKEGLKATQFAFEDKGIAYFRGEGADAQIVRTVFGLDAVTSDKVADRARQLRLAAGRLTGAAADLPAEADAPSLLDDAHKVLTDAGVDRIHLGDLRARLALLRSTTWSTLTVDALGQQLREAGVPTPGVKIEGRNTSGVRAADVAAARDDGEAAAG
ncbi:hypothetical protein DMP17_22310 [Pseudonocardia sp. TMWB2A]|uniref:hypothetical protein n=1 Tax=Pseudonocardia sp. TMWB2A TaxID=687430 RepID=UPI00307D8EC5